MLQKPAVLVLQPVIQRIVRYKAFCFTRGLQAADTDRSIRPHFTGAAERRAQCIRKRDIRLAHQKHYRLPLRKERRTACRTAEEEG